MEQPEQKRPRLLILPRCAVPLCTEDAFITFASGIEGVETTFCMDHLRMVDDNIQGTHDGTLELARRLHDRDDDAHFKRWATEARDDLLEEVVEADTEDDCEDSVRLRSRALLDVLENKPTATFDRTLLPRCSACSQDLEDGQTPSFAVVSLFDDERKAFFHACMLCLRLASMAELRVAWDGLHEVLECLSPAIYGRSSLSPPFMCTNIDRCVLPGCKEDARLMFGGHGPKTQRSFCSRHALMMETHLYRLAFSMAEPSNGDFCEILCQEFRAAFWEDMYRLKNRGHEPGEQLDRVLGMRRIDLIRPSDAHRCDACKWRDPEATQRGERGLITLFQTDGDLTLCWACLKKLKKEKVRLLWTTSGEIREKITL